MKKLTNDEIARLEAWAKTAGKGGFSMDQQQAMMVETINKLSSNDWVGLRAEEDVEDDKVPTTQAEARKKFEKLKKKSI